MKRPCNPPIPSFNFWMTQRKTGFPNKEPTIATLQHWIGEKGGKWKYKRRFFGVTLGFVQDCLKTHDDCN